MAVFARGSKGGREREIHRLYTDFVKNPFKQSYWNYSLKLLSKTSRSMLNHFNKFSIIKLNKSVWKWQKRMLKNWSLSCNKDFYSKWLYQGGRLCESGILIKQVKLQLLPAHLGWLVERIKHGRGSNNSNAGCSVDPKWHTSARELPISLIFAFFNFIHLQKQLTWKKKKKKSFASIRLSNYMCKFFFFFMNGHKEHTRVCVCVCV